MLTFIFQVLPGFRYLFSTYSLLFFIFAISSQSPHFKQCSVQQLLVLLFKTQNYMLLFREKKNDSVSFFENPWLTFFVFIQSFLIVFSSKHNLRKRRRMRSRNIFLLLWSNLSIFFSFNCKFPHRFSVFRVPRLVNNKYRQRCNTQCKVMFWLR